MKKAVKIIGILLLLLIIGGAIAWFGFLKPKPPPIADEDRAAITVLPLPSELDLGSNIYEIPNAIDLQPKGIWTPRLQKTFDRFTSRLKNSTGIPIRNGNGMTLSIYCQNKSDEYPSPNEIESYTLTIRKNKINLSAPTEWGILHGLETLLQLANNEGDRWYFPEVHIVDTPRYSWRGLMVDVCRHWIPKAVILRNLDAMAAVKMNVLHLHLTEHQGFRVESKTFPKLHQLGSNGNYFSQEDIKEIITYAADRGIRVVPEFDVPGHSTAWFVGHPELATMPGPYQIQTDFGVGGAVMDPTKEEVYTFLDAFFEEMASLFPDQYVHIGGDEVDSEDWENSTAVQDFMAEKGIEDYHALQNHFNTRIRKLIEGHGKKVMGWDEILQEDFQGDGVVIQSWRNHKSLWDGIRKGSKGVLSYGYYLDHKQTAGFHYAVDPEVIQGGITIDIDSTHWESWQLNLELGDTKMEGDLYLFGTGENKKGIVQMMGNSYDFENASFDGKTLQFSHEAQFGELNYALDMKGDSIMGTTKISVFTVDVAGKKSGGSQMEGGQSLPKFEKIVPLNAEESQSILGGEACMWSEMVDEHTIESRIWPRAGAIAEKLWSPQVLTDNTGDMYRRLMVFDDYLETLGTHHKNSGKAIIDSIVPNAYRDALTVLVNVLQEDKLFNRMAIYDTMPNVNTPLNRIVDASRPESYEAYRFEKDVDTWLETQDTALKSRLAAQLKKWNTNHQVLQPAFEAVEHIREVEQHSQHLYDLTTLAIQALENPSGAIVIAEHETLFQASEKAYGGTLLPVATPIKKLIQHNTIANESK